MKKKNQDATRLTVTRMLATTLKCLQMAVGLLAITTPNATNHYVGFSQAPALPLVNLDDAMLLNDGSLSSFQRDNPRGAVYLIGDVDWKSAEVELFELEA